MCAPGSKHSMVFDQLFRKLYAVLALLVGGYVLMQRWMAYEVAYILQRETAYLEYGIMPSYAQSKTYMPPEVSFEIEGLQRYVAALAAYDLEDGSSLYATAAFDLQSTDTAAVMQGLADWHAFLSPAQQHAHQLVTQMPLAWGTLETSTSDMLGAHLVSSHFDTHTANEFPLTLWLTGYLQGGVKRTAPITEKDGDNDTDPTAASSSSTFRPDRRRHTRMMPNVSAGVKKRPSYKPSEEEPPQKKPRDSPAFYGKCPYIEDRSTGSKTES